jgi:mono/diheme cytochrome c family protein
MVRRTRTTNGRTSSTRKSLQKTWILVLSLGLALAGVTVAVALRYRRDGPWEVPAAAKATQNPVAVTSGANVTAKNLYEDNCARCHGDRGDGDGPDANLYRPKPASLVAAIGGGNTPSVGGGMTDGEIFWKITEGRRPMPAFKKQLTDEQRWELVNFLRTLSEHPQDPAN